MLKDSSYLVLGIGTNVGKTHLVANLCCNKDKFMAIKPVITGFSNDNNSDSAKILLAQGQKINKKNLDKISPWRYQKPVSANFVSDIAIDELQQFCSNNIVEASNNKKILLIEGAGGVMSPIGKNFTFLDIATKLNIPILLVASNYLGSISHSLCSIEAILNKNLKIFGIIVNDYAIESLAKPVSDAQFIKCLKNFTDCEIFQMKNFIKNS